LILVGASIRDLLSDKNLRPDWKVIFSGSMMRLGLLPLLFLGTAILLPLPYELKAVLVIQAAMPSGMFPILMARHYGGSPHVAVQIVLATTALSFITIPLWVMLGLQWLGHP
jgi:malate permease and related proteins